MAQQDPTSIDNHDIINTLELHEIRFLLLLLFLSSLMLSWRLGEQPLSLDDESLYAQISVETSSANNFRDWCVPHFDSKPFFEKPPLCFWCVALILRVFGQSEFTLRLFPMICADLCVLFTFLLAKSFLDYRSSALACAILLLTPDFIKCSRMLLLDSPLTLVFLVALFFLVRKHYCLVGLCLGFAVLIKSAAVIPLSITLFIYWIIGQRPNMKQMISCFSVGLLVILPWYCYMTYIYGIEFWHIHFAQHILKRTTADLLPNHKPFWFYFSILFARNIPWGWLLPLSIVLYMRRGLTSIRKNQMLLMLLILVACVYGVYIIATTKVRFYVLPAAPAIAILVADWSNRLAGRWLGKTLILVACGFSLVRLGTVFDIWEAREVPDNRLVFQSARDFPESLFIWKSNFYFARYYAGQQISKIHSSNQLRTLLEKKSEEGVLAALDNAEMRELENDGFLMEGLLHSQDYHLVRLYSGTSRKRIE